MKFRKKIILIILIIFSFMELVSAQVILDNEYENDYKSLPFLGKVYKKPQTFNEFINSLDLTSNFSIGVYVNPHKKIDNELVSAPSPIIFPFSVGVTWPNYTFLAVEPELSFFMMNHLWSNSMALPAEIENRSSLTLSFMLNIPVLFTFFLGQNRFQMKAGIAFLLRAGLPAINDNTVTLEDEINKINTWFWEKGRFLYISSGVSWLYTVGKNTKVGPEISVFLPIGNLLFAQENVQGLIASAGLKFSF